MKLKEAHTCMGCCGLYCGLCAKYQSKAASRCVGCRLGEQHSWCSIWNCCVKKRGFVTCAECDELFQCAIFIRRKVAEWIPAADNLRRIKETGPKTWLREQRQRQAFLETLLRDYNEGRSMSYYCKCCARMPVDLIAQALREAKDNCRIEKIAAADRKSRAKAAKAILNHLALQAGCNLD